MTLQIPSHRHFEPCRKEQEYSILYSLCCTLEVGVPELLPWLGFICTQGFLQQMVQLVFVQLSAVSGNTFCVAALRHFGITSRTHEDWILFFPARGITRMPWELLAPERFSSCLCSRVTGLYWSTRSQSTCPSVCEARLSFQNTCRSKLEVFLRG